MTGHEIVERYKELKLKHRLIFVAFLAFGYPVYDWYDRSDVLLTQLEGAKNAQNESKQKNQTYKSKITGLPALEEKLSAVREKLENAKKLLPERVEVDKLLTKMGNFEKSIGVTLVDFEPKPQTRPDPTLQYAEVPIEIKVRGHFAKVMTLFDELVHFEELTHLRRVTMESETDKQQNEAPTRRIGKNEDDGVDILAKATLVAFKVL